MFFKKKIPSHILIGREDAMGDVILALPVCGLIKKYYPHCKITFLGRTYTKSIALSSVHVDEFMNYDDWQHKTSGEISALLGNQKIDTVVHLLPAIHIVKECWKAKINVRIGSAYYIKHWLYCNRLVPFSRKKSRLNEAQLNIKLLRPLKITEIPDRDEICNYYGFNKIPELDTAFSSLIDPDKFNLVIHPLSNKNAKEWGLPNFSELINKIDKHKYKLFITGSDKEKEVLADWINFHKNDLTDLTGVFNTDQLIAFIAASDGLIASSTGPVHIAAASGINTLGLYENRWKKRGERWGPIGKKADYLECINEDMDTITPQMVHEKIIAWSVKESK